MGLRRYLRFGMRTLLVMATLLCVVLGLVVVPARRQRQAVLELQRRGAEVEYEREGVPGHRGGPPWSQRWLGCDFGERVTWIVFTDRRTALTESDWRLIETCPPEGLKLEAKEQGNRDLARVGRLTTLKWLDFNNPSLTDQGLPPLRQLSQLRRLVIQSPLVTDAGLTHFTALSELKELWLYSTQVTAAGVAKLLPLPRCNIYLNGLDGKVERATTP